MLAGARWLLAIVAAWGGSAFANQQIEQEPLPGKEIAQFADPLPSFSGQRVQARTPGTSSYTVSMEEFEQQVLPTGYPKTWVWGYQVDGKPPHYPGFTVEAQRGVSTTVTYLNHLGTRLEDGTFAPARLQKYLTVDQTLHWADPLDLRCMFRDPAKGEKKGCYTPYGYSTWPGYPVANPELEGAPVPAVVHLHGAEDPSYDDGGPHQWFTPEGWRQRNPANGKLGPARRAEYGPAYYTERHVAGGAIFTYPNDQEATNLWFHDHALGTTRLNVYAGMAAYYLLRDQYDTGRSDNPIGLPADPYEHELAIQDRLFDRKGQLLFPDVTANPLLCGKAPMTASEPASSRDDRKGGMPPQGSTPSMDCHPFWVPEFFGDTIVVNGKAWPYLEVEPRRYRFRVLDGSDARFYNLAFADKHERPGPDFWIIGSDGGLLDRPVRVTSADRLLIAPGERYDVIVDFTAFAGKKLTLTNDANAPFPGGDPVDPATTGQIMQFRVMDRASSRDMTCDPAAGGRQDGRDDGPGDDDAMAAARAGKPAGACRLRGGKNRPDPIVRLADERRKSGLGEDVKVSLRRQLVLNEVASEIDEPLEVLLNNTGFGGLRESTMREDPKRIPDSVPSTYTTGVWKGDAHHDWVTELPRVGSTELWEIINTTGDAHPIHLHLIQFQLLDRQEFKVDDYAAEWVAAFPDGKFMPGEGPPYRYSNENNPTVKGSRIVGGNPLVDPYLEGDAVGPKGQETGWKDTIIVPPGTVTRIVARFAPQDPPVRKVQPGENWFSFDPTRGPGYVWHCHILEHEDNEMMRPYRVVW